MDMGTIEARELSGELYRGEDYLGPCRGVVLVGGGRARYGAVTAGLMRAEARRLLRAPLTISASGTVLHVRVIDVILSRNPGRCRRCDAAMGAALDALDPATLKAV
jgi:hypothetical protein